MSSEQPANKKTGAIILVLFLLALALAAWRVITLTR